MKKVLDDSYLFIKVSCVCLGVAAAAEKGIADVALLTMLTTSPRVGETIVRMSGASGGVA